MNKLWKIWAAALCVLLLAACAPQSGSSAQGAAAGGGLTLTDMAGRTVTLAQPPQRIVALLASDVEILYAIGAQDLLVGVGEYCDYPAKAKEKTVIASGAGTNIEQVLALSPDVVIMGEMAQNPQQMAQLTEAGVQVVQTNAADLDGVYRAITLLGELTGRTQQAGELTAQMQSAFDELRAKAGDKSKTIYFEVSPLEYGLWAAGSGTFMQELCDIVGLRNVFEDVNGWAEISQEQVLLRNPELIATVTMYYGEGPSPEEEILARAGWENVAAVAQGRIYVADNDTLTRPGPRLVDAARQLYAFAYGEA